MPYSLGDREILRSLFAEAGTDDLEIRTLAGTARFFSIESWMYTDVKGWTLSDMIDDVQYEELLQATQTELKRFVTSDGTVAFRAPAHVVVRRGERLIVTRFGANQHFSPGIELRVWLQFRRCGIKTGQTNTRGFSTGPSGVPPYLGRYRCGCTFQRVY